MIKNYVYIALATVIMFALYRGGVFLYDSGAADKEAEIRAKYQDRMVKYWEKRDTQYTASIETLRGDLSSAVEGIDLVNQAIEDTKKVQNEIKQKIVIPDGCSDLANYINRVLKQASAIGNTSREPDDLSKDQ